LFPEEQIHLPQTRQRWKGVLEQTAQIVYFSWTAPGNIPDPNICQKKIFIEIQSISIMVEKWAGSGVGGILKK
jgi:hypothetical protein